MSESATASPSPNAPEPRDDLDALKRRREAAELRSHIAALTAPWWRRASLVTVVTALLAAIIPVTTAIQQSYRNRRELALQEEKLDNDIRMAYLDRYQLPGHRLRTLRFLVGTSHDPKLVEWARSEIPLVEGELADIDKRLQEREKELDKPPPGKTKEDIQKEIDDLKNRKDVSSLVAPGVGPAPAYTIGNLAMPANGTMPMTLIMPVPVRTETKDPAKDPANPPR